MGKINNALILDDKITLVTDLDFNNDSIEYKSLRNIQSYFLKNSIPFSTITEIGYAPFEAIQKIKTITKPDLVVLDLDLNSDGDVDDGDESLIAVILKELHTNFGEFIILIYSTLATEWSRIRENILEKDPSLDVLLVSDNVIVFEKITDMTLALNELLSTELVEKKKRIFNIRSFKLNKMIRTIWNKEVIISYFFILGFLFILQFGTQGRGSDTFWTAIFVMTIAVIKFLTDKKKFKSDEVSNGNNR